MTRRLNLVDACLASGKGATDRGRGRSRKDVAAAMRPSERLLTAGVDVVVVFAVIGLVVVVVVVAFICNGDV